MPALKRQSNACIQRMYIIVQLYTLNVLPIVMTQGSKIEFCVALDIDVVQWTVDLRLMMTNIITNQSFIG